MTIQLQINVIKALLLYTMTQLHEFIIKKWVTNTLINCFDKNTNTLIKQGSQHLILFYNQRTLIFIYITKQNRCWNNVVKS